MRTLPDCLESRKCRRRVGAISLRLALGLFAVVVILGGLLGYYLAPGDPRPETEGNDLVAPESVSRLERRSIERSPAADAPILHRFALSEADRKDAIEAPSVTVDERGRIYLAWASETGVNEHTLWLTRSDDGGQSFQEPRAVVRTGIHTAVSEMRGRKIERRLRMLPHVASRDDTVYLVWVAGGPQTEDVVLQFADSTDGGLNFSPPIAVHTHQGARPTFTAMHVAADGTVICSWLDNRHGVQQPYAAIRDPGTSAFQPEQMVYAGPDGTGICPCCPTAAAKLGDDVVVAFRGNEAGYRDMWISKLTRGSAEFATPAAIVPPTWQFPGCPHDGPSLAVANGGLHLAWMDAHEGMERIYVARAHGESDSSGPVSSFAAAGDATQGHPCLLAAGETLHLVWDQSLPEVAGADGVERGEQKREEDGLKPVPQEPVPREREEDGRKGGAQRGHHHGAKPESQAGRAIHYAQSTDGGRSFSAPVPIALRPGAFQTRPRLAIAPSGTVFATWMELTHDQKQIVIAVWPKTTRSPAIAGIQRKS